MHDSVPTRLEVDVAVIGAGLAGLTAAHRLTELGHAVTVIEAKDRVGGRTARHELDVDGELVPIESGGQYTGPGQDELHAIAAEVGVELFETYAQGDSLWYSDGKPERYSTDDPPLRPSALREYKATVAKFDALSREIPTDAPWCRQRTGPRQGNRRIVA